MATLKEMFSQQLHDLQTDLDKKGQQVTSLTSENEELQTKSNHYIYLISNATLTYKHKNALSGLRSLNK